MARLELRLTLKLTLKLGVLGASWDPTGDSHPIIRAVRNQGRPLGFLPCCFVAIRRGCGWSELPLTSAPIFVWPCWTPCSDGIC